MSFSRSIVELVEASDSLLLKKADWWERAPQRLFATITNGYPWESVYFSGEDGVPLIRIRDITAGTTRTFYTGPQVEGFWVENGDLLIGMDGDFNCCLWQGGRALLNQRVCRVEVDKVFYNKKFLLYVLPGYLKAINEETHSVTVKHLSSKTLGDTPFPLPPRAEQDRLVDALDQLSARTTRASEELNLIPALLDRYRQAVLSLAFGGQLTATWREQNADAEGASRFVASRQLQIAACRANRLLGRDERGAYLEVDKDLNAERTARSLDKVLPESWAWCGIGELFGVYVGATPSRKVGEYWDGDIPWVSSGEVAFCRIEGTRESITASGLRDTSTRLHPAGTVLLGMIGEGKTRGQAAILDIPACNNQNCAAIRVSEASYPAEYIYWYLYSQYEATRLSGSGNNQPALNKDKVQRLLFPLAPPSEAEEVVRRIQEAFEWLDRVTIDHQKASRLVPKLQESLLAKALSGDLVARDLSEEPARVLLGRLQRRGADSKKPLRRTRSAV